LASEGYSSILDAPVFEARKRARELRNKIEHVGDALARVLENDPRFHHGAEPGTSPVMDFAGIAAFHLPPVAAP